MTLSNLQAIEKSILDLSTEEQQLLFEWMNENLSKNINQRSDLDDEKPPTLEEINQVESILKSAIISAINTP